MDNIGGISGSTIVELVKLGFFGFTVALLIFSAFIVWTLIKSNDQESDTRFGLKTRTAYILMGLSAAMFGGGLYLAITDRQPVQIYVEKSPVRSHFEKIALSMSSEEIPSFTDRTSVLVKRDEKITIDLDTLDQLIVGLERNIERNNEQIDGLNKQINSLNDAIFSNGVATGNEDESGI